MPHSISRNAVNICDVHFYAAKERDENVRLCFQTKRGLLSSCFLLSGWQRPYYTITSAMFMDDVERMFWDAQTFVHSSDGKGKLYHLWRPFVAVAKPKYGIGGLKGFELILNSNERKTAEILTEYLSDIFGYISSEENDFNVEVPTTEFQKWFTS